MGVSRYRRWNNRNDYAKFAAVGYGEFQPIERNTTPEGRAYNRRVDVVILREGPRGGRSPQPAPTPRR